MAQHDYAIANASGATVRADLNDALEAIVSTNSGASAPATTFAYMLWADTTASLLKMRDSTNSSWITIGTLDTTYLGLGSTLPGHLFGLTLSNNGSDATNDLDVAIGQATSDDAAAADRVLMPLSSAITKRLDAGWSVGTNQGGLDTGSIANTTYHVFLIERPDTGVVDVLFSTSASSPNMPANYTKKRRIGSIIRSAGAILPFTQKGNTFTLSTPILDINVTNPGTSAVTRTLTLPVGIVVEGIIGALTGGHAAATALYLSALTSTDVAASTSNAQVEQPTAGACYASAVVGIMSSTTATIRSRVSASDGNTVVYLITYGWKDDRGQSA